MPGPGNPAQHNPTETSVMNTDLRYAQLIVQGRRDLSPTAKLLHWTAIVCTCGMWLPVYWIARRSTRNVRY